MGSKRSLEPPPTLAAKTAASLSRLFYICATGVSHWLSLWPVVKFHSCENFIPNRIYWFLTSRCYQIFAIPSCNHFALISCSSLELYTNYHMGIQYYFMGVHSKWLFRWGLSVQHGTVKYHELPSSNTACSPPPELSPTYNLSSPTMVRRSYVKQHKFLCSITSVPAMIAHFAPPCH